MKAATAERLGFDPTQDESLHLKLTFRNAMVGVAPTGFIKVRVETRPNELIKMIGYDPRSLQPFRRGSKLIEPSRHVPAGLVELQREVQRTIDPRKVAEMVEYLHQAVVDGQYADWAELDVVTTAAPDISEFGTEHVVRLPEAADYIIIDGQHRHCALIDFVREYPELADKFTQGIAISSMLPEQIREWAGQGFHDKNFLRTAVKATKALSVDYRDAHNALAREAREHRVFRDGGGVEDTKDQLSSNSPEMITHSTLYRFVRGFTEGRRGLDKGQLQRPALSPESYEEVKTNLLAYLDLLADLFPTWFNKQRRGEFLFRSSPAWQALGVLGYHLFEIDDEAERKAMLAKIGEAKLDWRRSNLKWVNIIGVKQEEREEGSNKVTRAWITPRASRQAVDSTIGFLKKTVGIEEPPAGNGEE